MKFSRVVFSGIVAGIVWGVLYAIIHEAVETHDSSGRPVLPLTPFHGASMVTRAIVMTNPIILGISAIWLYAAIRPRFGAGPRTAVLAGLALWFLSTWIHVTWSAFTQVPRQILIAPLGVTLPITLVAVIAGAWLYKE
jgi:hypothetical protein